MNKLHKILLADGRAKVTITTLLFVLVGIILASYLAVISGDASQTEATAPFADNRLIVKFKTQAEPQLKSETQINGPDVGIASVSDLNRQEGTSKITELTSDRIYKIEYQNKKDVKRLAQQYIKDPNIEYAEPDYELKIALEPNDPYYASSGSWGQNYADLWGMKKIQAAAAWDATTGSRNVVVAVIDTGVDYTNPELAANMWTDGSGHYGYDFYNHDSDPMDDHAHGTHVAGTIGALGNNNLGVVGVNWQVKIMALKFLNSSGSGYTSDAVAAIHYAVDNGAKVLSNSWGGGGFDQSLQDAINYAYAHNVSFIAAAGNSNTDTATFYPCSMNNVICVAATDYQDQKASFSNYGNAVDLSAPGVDILSLKSSHATYNCSTVGSNYCRMSGTSMATPHVAGLAALILSADPNKTPDQVQTAMQNGANDLGAPGKDIYFGYGRINALNSVKSLAHLDGTLVKAAQDPAVYLLEGGKKRHIDSPEVFNSWFDWRDIVIISSDEINSYTAGDDLGFRPGTLIKSAGDPRVYLIDGSSKRYLTSPQVFFDLGYQWSSIMLTNSSEENKYNRGNDISAAGAHVDGALIRTADAPEVYLLDGGKKRHIANAEVFNSRYHWNEIVIIANSEMANYALGERVGFRPGSLVQARTQPEVYVIADTTKRHISSPSVFNILGYHWERIILTDAAELNNYTTGESL